MRTSFVEKNPRATKALLTAVMEAQLWCDKPENRDELATILGKRQWINIPSSDVAGPDQGHDRLRRRPASSRTAPSS